MSDENAQPKQSTESAATGALGGAQTRTAAYTGDASFFGTPHATRTQVVTYLDNIPGGTYGRVSLTEIVNAYFDVAAGVGVDPVMCIAQGVHEGAYTSWWGDRPRRNPAGLGVTGDSISVDERNAHPERYPLNKWARRDWRYEEGLSFASWANGSVPAHIGRLLAYAFAPGGGAQVQRDLIAYALDLRSLPLRYRGVGRTWRALDGRWNAAVTGYPDKIAAIANKMAAM